MTGEADEDNAGGTDTSEEREMDMIIEIKSSNHIGPFQMETLEGKISQVPARDMHVMVTPIGRSEADHGRECQIPPGVQVLHVYTTLPAGNKQVSIVVQNMTENVIFLKRGT